MYYSVGNKPSSSVTSTIKPAHHVFLLYVQKRRAKKKDTMCNHMKQTGWTAKRKLSELGTGASS